MQGQGKWWMGTFHGEPEQIKRGVGWLTETAASAAWGVAGWRHQLEKCPETGRIHMQWVVKFDKVKRFKQVQEALKQMGMEGAHLEQARSPGDAWKYCGKEESREEGPWEYGDAPGMRLDKAAERAIVARAAREGTSLLKLMEELDASVWQIPTLARTLALLRAAEPPMDSMPTLRWFWGDPGSGKSRAVADRAGGAGRVYKLVFDRSGHAVAPPSEHHTICELADLDKQRIPYGTLLSVFDWGAGPLRYVGGSFYPQFREYVITTNCEPLAIWGTGAEVRSLLRRVSRIVHFPTTLDAVQLWALPEADGAAAGGGGAAPPFTAVSLADAEDVL